MFAIGIPTLNRYDLLKESLAKYLQDFPNVEIHVIDNGSQGIDADGIILHDMGYNMGVAASWNKLCREIFAKHDHALILNDDIYLGYNTETVLKAIEKNPESLIRSERSWSLFLIPKKLYEKVGDFDEGFYPAYYEDSDYIYRMLLSECYQEVDRTLNPEIFLQSQTYEKNPDLVNDSMKRNRLRYIEKWGGSPLFEQFISPFNKPIPNFIEKMNIMQRCGRFHPLTCNSNHADCKRSQSYSKRNEGETVPFSHENEGVLIATEEGWVCPCGNYKQKF